VSRVLRLALAGALAACWVLPSAGVQARRRAFPDTSARIAVLTDQLPGNLTSAQIRFAATHYVGSQKLTLDQSQPLRAINPDFVVLHYRLAMWQSAPRVTYIVDGRHWSNDFPDVNRHEAWFWHNEAGQRVTSNQDGKLLMNIGDPGFRAYWRDSIARQVRAGDYDGVFLDSASPAVLQWEARAPADERLLGKGARFSMLAELGGRTWIASWQDWIAGLDASLAADGARLIPNIGALATSWDDTDYSLTAGVFCEGFLDPGWPTSDWKAAANRTLSLVRSNRIVILQNYLKTVADVQRRTFLLGSYLLVKGAQTYVSYFTSPLDWFPEWELDLGRPLMNPSTIDDLLWGGVYRRDFERGIVLVNTSTRNVMVNLNTAFDSVEPVGGGPIQRDGTVTGRLAKRSVTRVELFAKSAEVLMRR
jgi:hypothetical protein